MNSNVKTCCICDGDAELVAKRKDKYSYFQCLSCGLVFSSPLPTEEEIYAYYDGFMYRKPDKEALTAFSVEVGKNVRKIATDLDGFGKATKRTLLDFGGGLGFYASSFSEIYDEVCLADIDSRACNYAREIHDEKIEVVDLTIDASRLEGRTFDVIYANQVVEHYADLEVFFEQLKRYSHDETIVVITTPNQESKSYWFRIDYLYHYLSRVAAHPKDFLGTMILFVKKTWQCCDPPRHIYSFNSTNMKKLCDKYGFEVVSTRTTYCVTDYYSVKKYSVFSAKTLKEFVMSLISVYVNIGERLLMLFDPGRRYGDDLIVFAKLNKSAR